MQISTMFVKSTIHILLLCLQCTSQRRTTMELMEYVHMPLEIDVVTCSSISTWESKSYYLLVTLEGNGSSLVIRG